MFDLVAIPWITHISKMFLDAYIKPDMNVFEWGMGGSTLYFIEKGCSVVSVEHSQEWYDKVMSAVGDYAKCKLMHIPPEHGAIRCDKADPDAYYSECVGNFKFVNYASAIDLQGLFDIVLIDGRARPSCILHAVDNIVPGGLLILDNTERPYYLEKIGHVLEKHDRAVFRGHGPHIEWVWETTVWMIL